jgi:hypothetical protein
MKTPIKIQRHGAGGWKIVEPMYRGERGGSRMISKHNSLKEAKFEASQLLRRKQGLPV